MKHSKKFAEGVDEGSLRCRETHDEIKAEAFLAGYIAGRTSMAQDVFITASNNLMETYRA